MTAFGYSPTQAEEAKDKLEADLSKIKDRAEHLKRIVPDVGAVADRCALLVEEFAEVVTDLQAIVDRRTDEDRG